MTIAPIMHRIRVKFCGITNQKDAEDAVELGADALGFNTYPASKRFIDLHKESDWIRNLPHFVSKVAVTVNPSIKEAEALFNLPFINSVQFHGDEDEAFCAHFAKLELPFIKSIPVKDNESLEKITRFCTSHILLDAYAPGTFGGTGKVIDWNLAAEFVASHPDILVLLSGGLSPINVTDAIRLVRPFAVDVASGIESQPRKKDRTLMSQFIQAVFTANGNSKPESSTF